MKHKINTGFFVAVFVTLAVLNLWYVIPWWAFVLPPVLWFAIAAPGSGLISSNYHIKAYCKNPAVKGNKIAITFDDGPTPETEKVLDLLEKYNAKATFFCIGRQIEKYPEILKRTVSEGHTVGNHTYSHATSFGMFSTKRINEELQQTDGLIEAAIAKKPLFFRPPFGVTTPKMARAVKITGHSVIGWSNRSLDGILTDEDVIFKRIEHRLTPGCIILLHDTSQKTVNVLERLLVFLQHNNYESVTVDQLLNIPAYEN